MRRPTAVVGAGVVGLAVARALAMRGREVLVLEAADRIATGVTSRNSEVIHAGLYYPPDSLKARTCLRGRELLYAYAIRPVADALEVHTDEHVLACDRVVLANGLDGLRLAATCLQVPPPPTKRAKGSYMALSGCPPPFRHLVYPLPEPGGLGIHATVDLAGQVRFGPDVE